MLNIKQIDAKDTKFVTERVWAALKRRHLWARRTKNDLFRIINKNSTEGVLAGK